MPEFDFQWVSHCILVTGVSNSGHTDEQASRFNDVVPDRYRSPNHIWDTKNRIQACREV